MDYMQAAAQAAQFLMANWQIIGEILLVILPGLALAIRHMEWRKLLILAGRFTYLAADMAELDKEAKRTWVAKRLQDSLPLWAKPLISAKSIEVALEYGWHKLAKPQLKEGQ